MTLQDAAFYVDCEGSQVVWSSPDNTKYVIRNGEMRIVHHGDPMMSFIRYTDRLVKAGFTTDEDIGKLESGEVESWEVVNNAWFEVVDKEDGDYFSDPFFTLSEAIEEATGNE